MSWDSLSLMEVKVGPMGATHWDQMIIEAGRARNE